MKVALLHLSSKLRIVIPDIDVILSFFLFFTTFSSCAVRSSFQVNFLILVNCTMQIRQVVATITALKGLGGLLFVFGSSFGAYLLVCLYLSYAHILMRCPREKKILISFCI